MGKRMAARRLGSDGRIMMSLALSAAIAVVACHRANPGAPCPALDRVVCTGRETALVCDQAAWRSVPCRGPRGCTRRENGDDCDDTLAAPGDACPHDPAIDYACSVDRSDALVCEDGRFDLWRHCRGPRGCKIVNERHLDCDTTLSEPDDPCEKEGAFACSVDRTALLRCTDRHFAPASSCRGPAGCSFDPETQKVDCADGRALEGDPCDQPRRIACSVDGKEELVCDGNRYAKKRDCRRTDCRLEGTELFCD